MARVWPIDDKVWSEPFLQDNWPFEVACIYQDKVFLPLLFLMQVVYGCCVEAMIEATTTGGGRWCVVKPAEPFGPSDTAGPSGWAELGSAAGVYHR